MEEILKWPGQHPGIATALALVLIGVGIAIFTSHRKSKEEDIVKPEHNADHAKHDDHAHATDETKKEKDPHKNEGAHGEGGDHDHDHGTKQTGWDVAATFLWQLFWIGVLCAGIWYIGIPYIKRKSTPDSKLVISFDPPSTKAPVRPPADTTAILHLVAGKESEPVTTQTWWYDGHLLEGTVTDLRIVHPDESESVYRNVSQTNLPQGLHIAPGSKIYYTSKRGGKVFIAHF